MELDEELKQNIIGLIRQGRRIPVPYKNLLFPLGEKAQEIELIYGIKERKEDILADTMSVPFQAVKKFGTMKKGEWHNKLIFADNIQALKFMLKDPEIKGKVKLIYIDPPFGTGDLYDANGVPVYSAALQGAEFIEFFRKRLILLNELLANDGSIFVRIDYHFGHYVKVIMDEIFSKNNFRNEIIVRRGQAKAGFFKQFEKIKSVAVAYDVLLWYSKSPSTRFSKISKQAKEEHRISGRWSNLIKAKAYARPTMRYEILGARPEPAQWMWSRQRALDAVRNYERYLEITKKSNESQEEYWIRTGQKHEFVRRKGNQIQYWIPPRETELVDNNWLDVKGYDHITDYPTENSEELLGRVLQITEPNDLVLDCYAGSGTTGVVAEKMGRRWIMVDTGRFSIYTIIKRLHCIKTDFGNKGKLLKPKPFVLYNAGLYEDHGFILNIEKDQYKQFAMDLFQVEPKQFEINGLEMDGVLFSCPVKVFSQKGYLTEEFIDELHETVGDQLKGRMFIISPASRVYFLQDYIEKDGVRYYVLRIPYSVIDELHKRAFKRPMQPTSSAEINQLVEQVGFDFIHPPVVKAVYFRRKPKDRLAEQELCIEIKEFKAVQRSKEPIELKDPKDALSMVLVDRDYNGEYFNMTDFFFRKELEKEDWKTRIPDQSIGKRIMIIYLDIFGNERVEVRESEDFKQRS
jgi:site-specific DNA-methyltransferase (adenine-specific)/adenine-specific DNA-methyltransferase